MPTDEQLAEAACTGDESAFPELVRRYQARLLRFLVTRCATLADAEDALQDTFTNAYRYLASFDPRWRFSTWLYRIGIREAARAGPPVSAITGENVDVADPGADPLAACIRDSGRDNLWAVARSCLSNEAYAALWMRYVEDMSVRDVARTLDRNETWAKVTLMRSRQRLAAALGDAPETGQKGAGYG